MPLEIAQLGQPVLREMAKEVTPAEIASADFQALVDDMLATKQASKGVGLAAPQVFVGQRLFVADVLPPEARGDRRKSEVFINPRLSELSEERESDWEGCLSFLELLVLVPRHVSIRVDYLDRLGQPRALQLSGFPARVVQHEYDHLDGVLTIDRASTTKNIIKASESDDAIAYRD